MTRLLALSLTACALAACSTDSSRLGAEADPSAESAPPGDWASSAPPFFGTEWRPVALAGARLDSLPGADALISVAFTDGPFGDLDPKAFSLGGYDGCNDFGMGYRLDGDPASANGAEFRVGAVASNLQACGAPGEHVSDYVVGRIGEARRVRLDGGRLTLFDSLGVESAAFVPRPVRSVDPTALATGRWRLDPEASSVAQPDGQPLAPYEVAFRPDSTYTGEAGCARFGGTYTLAGDHFWHTSSNLYDVDGCAPDAPERRGISLELATGEAEADADRLVLHRRWDGRTLVFARVDR